MSPTERVELKPCPFCGREAEIERRGDHRVSTIYRCTYCSCSLETGEEWGHGTAWNRRALIALAEHPVQGETPLDVNTVETTFSIDENGGERVSFAPSPAQWPSDEDVKSICASYNAAVDKISMGSRFMRPHIMEGALRAALLSLRPPPADEAWPREWDVADRLKSLLEPDDMHPVGCSSWVDEAAAFIALVSIGMERKMVPSAPPPVDERANGPSTPVFGDGCVAQHEPTLLADERVKGLVDALDAACTTLAASSHLIRKYAFDHHWLKEHDKRISEAKAALASYLAMIAAGDIQCDEPSAVSPSAWLPIETAPRDGTEMVTWSTQLGDYLIAAWDGAYFIDPEGRYWSRRQPTHWMPLPNPPDLAADGSSHKTMAGEAK